MGNLARRIPDLLFEIGWIQKFGQKKTLFLANFEIKWRSIGYHWILEMSANILLWKLKIISYLESTKVHNRRWDDIAKIWYQSNMSTMH